MSTWSKNELRKIAEADDLHISPFREDAKNVRHSDVDLVRGGGRYPLRARLQRPSSRWYQAAVRQQAGRITAAGMTKEVTFELVDGPINDLIDDAYGAKYHGSPYLGSMISARARSATVKIVPRESNASKERKTP
jgi:hypothetical protein